MSLSDGCGKWLPVPFWKKKGGTGSRGSHRKERPGNLRKCGMAIAQEVTSSSSSKELPRGIGEDGLEVREMPLSKSRLFENFPRRRGSRSNFGQDVSHFRSRLGRVAVHAVLLCTESRLNFAAGPLFSDLQASRFDPMVPSAFIANARPEGAIWPLIRCGLRRSK